MRARSPGRLLTEASAAAAAAPAAAPPPQEASTSGEIGLSPPNPLDPRSVALAVAVVCLWLLWGLSAGSAGPLYLLAPPITRRPSPFLVDLPPGAPCSAALNDGGWTALPVAAGPGARACSDAAAYAGCAAAAERQWEFGAAARACGARAAPPADVVALLAGGRVACVGDSVARQLCSALLRSLGASAADLAFERHADFGRRLGGVAVDFRWAPFPANATAALAALAAGGGDGAAAPLRLVVVSTGLWHLLHVGDAAAYGADVRALRAAVAPLAAGGAVVAVATAAEVHTEQLASLAKRARMAPALVDAYNRELAGAGVWAPAGPAALLDVFRLTWGCGPECTVDGVHSRPGVYDAALALALSQVRAAGGGGGGRGGA